jgi:hypothetical protein
MIQLARAIEARAPRRITCHWRGKRLVVVGKTASGAERRVYVELATHGKLDQATVRTAAGRDWPNLARAVLYETMRAGGPARLREYLQACAMAKVWSGAPAERREGGVPGPVTRRPPS